ncbi:N-acetylmuramoyl-L-alanine amidase [Bacteroides sp. 519]|uniref:N-acetylmuramoyl-L-alanine amidase family protein n=1 Tax=Bacteroides sp. 519 TaxID=2302937 RepID=UPI0013D327BA|nr:N-acetylmuramoyl-L-alanine amidase [Bacteroides sp. 519]NDV59275.1 N-acetylmuramoyl-L-alanine amidase [Bacteroides sp. 519]
MSSHKQHIFLVFLCLGVLLSPFCSSNTWARDFIVVIDAGHGGKDPGALGKISKEKDINLKVALKVGNLIKKNCKDVNVIYTRDKDVFISLDKRAEIANNAKADLFISIHTNSVAKSKTLQGASTWTLGLARSQANLEVAKRENAVIEYESDYKTRYARFDHSSESYIMYEFMQDKFMEQSVQLATLMQQQFKNSCKRIDKGVHQAQFLVLHATAMPSVLIELGFISTPEEEKYLNTENGANTMAKGIYQAFLQYKSLHNTNAEPLKHNEASTQNVTPKTSHVTEKVPIVFMVQITTSSNVLKPGDQKLKGLKGVRYYKERNIYKYTYGASEDYNKIVKVRKDILSKFKDAFIIAFRNGEKMNINDAIQEFKNTRK